MTYLFLIAIAPTPHPKRMFRGGRSEDKQRQMSDLPQIVEEEVVVVVVVVAAAAAAAV